MHLASRVTSSRAFCSLQVHLVYILNGLGLVFIHLKSKKFYQTLITTFLNKETGW